MSSFEFFIISFCNSTHNGVCRRENVHGGTAQLCLNSDCKWLETFSFFGPSCASSRVNELQAVTKRQELWCKWNDIIGISAKLNVPFMGWTDDQTFRFTGRACIMR